MSLRYKHKIKPAGVTEADFIKTYQTPLDVGPVSENKMIPAMKMSSELKELGYLPLAYGRPRFKQLNLLYSTIYWIGAMTIPEGKKPSNIYVKPRKTEHNDLALKLIESLDLHYGFVSYHGKQSIDSIRVHPCFARIALALGYETCSRANFKEPIPPYLQNALKLWENRYSKKVYKSDAEAAFQLLQDFILSAIFYRGRVNSAQKMFSIHKGTTRHKAKKHAEMIEYLANETLGPWAHFDIRPGDKERLRWKIILKKAVPLEELKQLYQERVTDVVGEVRNIFN